MTIHRPDNNHLPAHIRELSDRVRAEIGALEPVTPSLWPRRVLHTLVSGGGATAILFSPEEGVQWVMVIGSMLFVLSELIRALLPAANDFAIGYLPFFKQRERHEVTGLTYGFLAVTIAVFAFDKEVVVLALIFLAVGDPVAASIGRWDPRFRVFGKSLIGTIAFALSATLAGFLATFHPDISLGWWLIAGAAVAAIAELLPLPIDDNVTIPLTAAGLMALLV
jgi:glycerol-3-phosphate acyltransferase PlsY